MKLKNRNLYKKAFRAEFFLIAQKKLSDINRVEEFKENIMLDHRTETFMAVCSVMNYREAAELLHITQPAVTQHIQFLEKEYGCRLFLYENRKLIKTPIEATLAAKKSEQMIMSLMPVGIILYLQMTSPGFLSVLYGNPFGIAAMSICLVIYAAAYWLGRRIVDIEV